MTEPDALDRNIHALKELQRVAWQQLADPSVTASERRELRNQIKQSSADLRYCLEMASERARFRVRVVKDAAGSPGKSSFRLLA